MDAAFIAQLATELGLLLFNASVAVCVLLQRRKKHVTFRSNFFLFYLLQSCADIALFTLEYVQVRLPGRGIIQAAPFGNLFPFFMVYAIFFQLLMHTVIAGNRYAVLAKASSYKATKLGEWRLRTILIIIAITPLVGAIPRLIGSSRRVETSPGVFAQVRDIPWLFSVTQGINALYSFLNSTVSVIFELKSLFVYRSLSSVAKARCRNDFLLLIYAFMQFFVQAAASAYYCSMCYGAAVGNPAVIAAAQAISPLIYDFLCLSGPVCLLTTR